MRLNPIILILNLMLSITVAEVGAMEQKGEFLSEIIGKARKIIPTFFATAECSSRSQRGFDDKERDAREIREIRERAEERLRIDRENREREARERRERAEERLRIDRENREREARERRERNLKGG